MTKQSNYLIVQLKLVLVQAWVGYENLTPKEF